MSGWGAGGFRVKRLDWREGGDGFGCWIGLGDIWTWLWF